MNRDRFGSTASDTCQPADRFHHECHPLEHFDAPAGPPIFPRARFVLEPVEPLPLDPPRRWPLWVGLVIVTALLFLPLVLAILGEPGQN